MSNSAAAPVPRRRDFPAWIYITSFFVIVLIALLPILSTIIAVAIANTYGCTVNEGNLNPCLIGGADWGYWLQFGGMSFLYIFLTLPLGIVLFVIWLVVFLIHLGRFNKKKVAA